MRRESFDFEITIGERMPQGYPVDLRSPAGRLRGVEYLNLPFTGEEIANVLARMADHDTDDPLLKDFGGKLCQSLFQGPVKTLYERSRGMVGEEQRLRLRLLVKDASLALLPWELLYDSESRQYLALSPSFLLVRGIALPQRFPLLAVEPPLRVLVVAASPRDLRPLDLDRELALMDEAIAPLRREGRIEVDILRGNEATAAGLQDKLREGYHVLHFIGHGAFEERGYLMLEDGQGYSHAMADETLGVLLNQRGVRLALLNACESAQGAERDALLGVAPALVNSGLPAVIAMQFPFPDDAAAIFSREFYRALADGWPVDAALVEARQAVLAETGMGEIDWAVPVLFLGAENGELFPPARAVPRWQRPQVLALLAALLVIVGVFGVWWFRLGPGRRVEPTPLVMTEITPIAELPPGTPTVAVARWPIAVGLAGLEGCPPEMVSKLHEEIMAAFEPSPKGLSWQTEPERAFASGEEARAWAAERELNLVIWGRCPESGHLEVAAELVDVPQAPEMAELSQVVTHAAADWFFYPRDLMAGLVAYATGDYEIARSRWELLDDVVEAEPGMESAEIAQLFLLQGNSRVYAGKYAAAVPYYEQVLSFDEPLSIKTDAANNLGVAHLNHQLKVAMEAEQQDLSEALAAYRSALEMDPNYVLAYLNRADAYMLLYEWDAALANCEKALLLSDWQLPAAFFCRGVVHYGKPDGAEAEADFRGDMEKARDLGQGTYAPPYFMLGHYYERRDKSQAHQNYSTYLDLIQCRPYLELDRMQIEDARAIVGG